MSWKERESVNKITQSSVCSIDKDLALSIMYENYYLGMEGSQEKSVIGEPYAMSPFICLK